MPPDKTNSNIEVQFVDTNAILQHVLKTITDKCKEEAEINNSVIPFTDHRSRISHYTGLSNLLINKWITGKPEVSRLCLQSRISILNKVKSLYIKHKLPTYTAIFEENPKNLKTAEEQLIVDVRELLKEMNVLGYTLKETVHNGIIAMEDPEITFERFKYLVKIKKFRSDTVQPQQIVYIDERVINETQHFKKLWQVDSALRLSGLQESVFYHAVTKSGFITGMFTNQVSEEDFAKWLSDILLIHLKSPSVFIMDSNPLHGSLVNSSPISRYHSKIEMLRWLTNKNIPCSNNMSKPALYELIAKCNDDHREYKIDCIIRSHGHEVLRMPRHFFDLSITTLFWDNIVKNGGIPDTNSLMERQLSLMKILNSVPSTTWAEYEQSIVKIENELLDIDMSMENFCDMYEIKLSCD